MKKILSLVLLLILGAEASVLEEIFNNAEMNGQLRLGAVEIEDEAGENFSTLALGGNLGVKTKAINGISLGTTLYSTNALFGKNEEGMFLDSKRESYSILGEAYVQAMVGKTSIKAGRQILDTPYADSDDIGMIPNTFEGFSIVSQELKDTTIVLASLDKWSGVDSAVPEKFNKMQDSGDAVLTAGVIYEGIENTTLQGWHYKLDDGDFNYLEAGYEREKFNVGVQYTDQDNDNSAFGLRGELNMGDLVLSTAYNKVKGVVSNGFGGGPFFTSAEDHTIEIEERDEEGILVGAEYSLEKLTLAFVHANFEKGENDTDYIVNYAVNNKYNLDLIYSDMYDDGTMVRFFANYNF